MVNKNSHIKDTAYEKCSLLKRETCVIRQSLIVEKFKI